MWKVKYRGPSWTAPTVVGVGSVPIAARRKYPFRPRLSAKDRIFHRKIIPPAIAPCGVDAAGFQIIDQCWEVFSAMFIEHHVGELDVDEVARKDAVVLV